MPGLDARQKSVAVIVLLGILLLSAVLITSVRDQAGTVEVAVAKGKQMLDQNLAAAPALDVGLPRQLAYQDLAAALGTQPEQLEFVNAVLLTSGEARYWQEAGCSGENCAHVTFYNHAGGGSAEAVVQLENEQVVAWWTDSSARPGGSTWVLPRALEIAAADSAVSNILGNIGEADPAMVPMSGWLVDSACRDEWCVDLTFHDPNGTGRIFHVFVNMESDRVERTFYTRARPERSAAPPLAQRDAFTDGCHEAYEWEVCWEMTAHDGIDFRDATYRDDSIFQSAKIGQIEAWYPSWPGGYRDEIGFSATVPPYGDTQVNDLGNGFEVRQFFTEFERWPNCICCYRYEEIVRFFEDGVLEFEFVSHGPGCDDLSIYRPFWRIDVDLGDSSNDTVWLWEDLQWQEQLVEFEEHPLVDHLSPAGEKLAIVDEDLHYRWSMEQTDPLSRDEGYIFLLQFDANEGAGPILTGPGDTFIPPREWIDGDDLSGENVVLWHVPLLKTNKSEPWWCMPDPDPDFSPCHTVLRAVPAAEFEELTPEEMATMAAEPQTTVTPETAVTPAPSPTPRPVEGENPEEIVLNAGCTSCHQIGALGEHHKVGPDLSDIGWLAQGRVAGMSARDYISQSIIDPNIYLAPECPNGPCMANIMPRDYGQRLTQEQQESLVEYLLEQQVEPQPVGAVTRESFRPAPTSPPPPAQEAPAISQRDVRNVQVVTIILVSLAFLIGLIAYFKDKPEAGE